MLDNQVHHRQAQRKDESTDDTPHAGQRDQVNPGVFRFCLTLIGSRFHGRVAHGGDVGALAGVPFLSGHNGCRQAREQRGHQTEFRNQKPVPSVEHE